MIDVLLVSQSSGERKRVLLDPIWTPKHLNILLNKGRSQEENYFFTINGKPFSTSLETFTKENILKAEEMLVIVYFLVQKEASTDSPIRVLMHLPAGGVFSGLNNGKVEIRREKTLQLEKKMAETRSPVLGLGVSETKDLLLCSHQNGTVYAYKINEIGSETRSLSFSYKEDAAVAESLLFGQCVYSVDWAGFIHRRSLVSSEKISKKIHTERIIGMISAENLLITGSWDGLFKEINKETLSVYSSLSMDAAVTALSVFPHGQLVCACSNGTIRKVDMRTREKPCTIKTQSAWISSIKTRDETVFSCSSYDGRVSVFDARTNNLQREFFCPDTKIMAHCWTGENTILTGDASCRYRNFELA